MKRFFLILSVALGAFALSACSKSEQRQEEKSIREILYPNGEELRDRSISSVYMKKDIRYNIWLPTSYNHETAYPILYLLHGAGDNQDAWLDPNSGNAAVIASKYMREGGTPMIIVMPDAQLTFYLGDYEKFLHQELMPKVETDFKFSGKRAIAGLSMGGFGTLYHALTYPDKFTYAYAMSPAACVDWPGFGTIVTLDDMKAKAASLEGLSVRPDFTIEVGNQDTTVDNAKSKELSDAINEAAHCEWIARDGIHYWTFWPDCLAKALVKIGNTFK